MKCKCNAEATLEYTTSESVTHWCDVCFPDLVKEELDGKREADTCCVLYWESSLFI